MPTHRFVHFHPAVDELMRADRYLSAHYTAQQNPTQPVSPNTDSPGMLSAIQSWSAFGLPREILPSDNVNLNNASVAAWKLSAQLSRPAFPPWKLQRS